MRQAVIGVMQPGGLILTATLTGDADVSRKLRDHYDNALRATMLVSLGAIAMLGSMPRTCVIASNAPEPVLLDMASFERLSLGDSIDFHLFDHGAWTSWSDGVETGALFAFEDR